MSIDERMRLLFIVHRQWETPYVQLELEGKDLFSTPSQAAYDTERLIVSDSASKTCGDQTMCEKWLSFVS